MVIADRQGKIVKDLSFEHTAEGWAEWKKLTSTYAGLAVAIETNQGAAIGQLLHHGGLSIYPVTPRAPNVIGIAKLPVAPKQTFWMLGVWAMRCESMGTAGEP